MAARILVSFLTTMIAVKSMPMKILDGLTETGLIRTQNLILLQPVLETAAIKGYMVGFKPMRTEIEVGVSILQVTLDVMRQVLLIQVQQDVQKIQAPQVADQELILMKIER